MQTHMNSPFALVCGRNVIRARARRRRRQRICSTTQISTMSAMRKAKIHTMMTFLAEVTKFTQPVPFFLPRMDPNPLI